MARKAVETVKNAVLYDDGLIKIENVRYSYPHLRKPFAGKAKRGEGQSEPKFGVVGMLPKKTHKEAYELISDEIDRLMKEGKIKALASDKKFLRDGDEHENEDYAGHWIVSARETRRPALRDIEKEIVDPQEADEVFYGGCWGSILIRPWLQNNEYGKRVNAGLSACRKSKDDEPFGDARITDEDVDEAFDDDEDEGSSSRRSSSRGSSRSRGRDYEDEEEEKPRRRSRDDDDRSSRRSSSRRSRDDDPDDI